MNTQKQLKYLTNPKTLAEIDWIIEKIFNLRGAIKKAETNELYPDAYNLKIELQYVQKRFLFLLDEIIDNIILNN